MFTSDFNSFDDQHEFGNTGWRCSKFGWGTGSDRLVDTPTPADCWSPQSIRESLDCGINVFELGCFARQPDLIIDRLATLAQQLGTTDRPAGDHLPIAIIRFSMRQVARKPVDLEYQLRTESPQEIFDKICKRFSNDALSLEQTTQQCVRLVWIWDDFDFRDQASRQCRQQFDQLLELLLGKFSLPELPVGIGGIRWQSLAELIAAHELQAVLLQAAGILGPDLEAGLIPVCRRQGTAILTSLPCFGGLIGATDALPVDHPATSEERLAARTAAIVAQEHGIDSQVLAWSDATYRQSIDCCLLQLPTNKSIPEAVAALPFDGSKRTEALVTRHLRSIQRTNWYQ